MIWVVVVLTVGLTVTPSLFAYYMFQHLRHLSEQNQILTAALMATKNSPYAALAADITQNRVAEPSDIGPEDGPLVHEGDRPGGARLIGT